VISLNLPILNPSDYVAGALFALRPGAHSAASGVANALCLTNALFVTGHGLF
jgi:hypothetical protein